MILAVLAIGMLAGLVLLKYRQSQSANSQTAGTTAPIPQGNQAITAAAQPKAPPVGAPDAAAASADHSSQPAPQSPPALAQNSKTPSQPRAKPAPAADESQPIFSESFARAALDLVGADPLAERVWVTAINDPLLSADDRQNLIEDLNENGLSDPNHPAAADLPLIEARLALTEQLAPDAMDDVNAAAFDEAYKDLMNMYHGLTGM
jgi:hypothetical protein